MTTEPTISDQIRELDTTIRQTIPKGSKEWWELYDRAADDDATAGHYAEITRIEDDAAVKISDLQQQIEAIQEEADAEINRLDELHDLAVLTLMAAALTEDAR